MKSGWRVRRAHARRRERLLQDFIGFPVQAGPATGPSAPAAKTQQTCGSVQVVKADQALETLQGKHTSAHDRASTPSGRQHPKAVLAHGPLYHLDRLDHTDPASTGAAFSGPNRGIPPGPSGPAFHWTDLDRWCARIGAAGLAADRRVVLREWVAAAGGWSDAAAVHLPASLPRRLALGMLKTHARMLALTVHDDPDSADVTQWLTGSRHE